MTELEDYKDHAEQISREIGGKLVALGIDWQDEVAMRKLAREALETKGNEPPHLEDVSDPFLRRAHVELHGLIGLMLQTMTESANVGYQVHGGDAWKALARALWAEKEAAASTDVSRGTE